MAEQAYPENEKLSFQRSEWSTLVDYMEFLSSKGIQLMKWVEREYDEPCTGTMFHECIGGKHPNYEGGPSSMDCSNCKGTGSQHISFKGYEPVSLADNNLLYEHLQVDPKKLEAERRAMLSSLGA